MRSERVLTVVRDEPGSVERHWYDPTAARDGGEPSMLASPLVLLVLVFGAVFWTLLVFFTREVT